MTEACSPPKPGLDGLFDCNICLETASEPVVTLCGHLYCWGCIWRWLEVQECPQCPICKSSIAQERMLPIYGRGRPQVDPRSHTHDAGEAIPTRPPAASRASAAAPASRQNFPLWHTRDAEAEAEAEADATGAGVGGGERTAEVSIPLGSDLAAYAQTICADDIVVRIRGVAERNPSLGDSSACDGLFVRDPVDRNDHPCFTNVNGHGSLYFVAAAVIGGGFWKLCREGTGSTCNGWNFSQVAGQTGIDLPAGIDLPTGVWTERRCTPDEHSVEYGFTVQVL